MFISCTEVSFFVLDMVTRSLDHKYIMKLIHNKGW